MFSLQIVDSDAFLDMPLSSQVLYFHLAMRADDDGFIDNPKRIMRTIGAAEDDMKVVLAKRFVLAFESGVVVIKHWKINNYIQSDRYRETKYLEEKKRLTIKENGAYTDRIQDVYKMETQIRLGKNRLDKKADSCEPGSKVKKKPMKKNSFKYNESNPSDFFEEVIDLDTGERARGSTSASPAFKQLLKWAEDRRGFKFLSVPKQFKAFALARTNSIEPSRLQQRWKDMENDKFWLSRGFDWMDVVISFNKKQ